MRIAFWIIALPIVVIAMAFAVSNSESAVIALWPLPYRLEVPLYAAVTGALFLGLVAGLTYGWITSLRLRHRAHAESKRADHLETEIAELRRKLAVAESAARVLPPPSPPPYAPDNTLRHIGTGAPE